MQELTPATFTGLLPTAPRPMDYVAGSNSPLMGTKIMPDRNWLKHFSGSERQSIPGVFDTMNCTAFALATIIEMWIGYLIAAGEISASKTPDHWGFLKSTGMLSDDGKVHVSPRFIGHVAGTGPNGNYLTTVLDAVRKYGFCSERVWPWDKNVQRSYSTYYAKPSEDAFKEAEVAKRLFDLAYEFFYNSPGMYMDAIKECPLYDALITCGGWQTDDPVKWCGVTYTNHCVVTGYINDEGAVKIADSYPEYIKNLALDYQIPYALKVFLTIKKDLSMTKVYRLNDHGKLGIAISEGFNLSGIYAKDKAQYETLCKAYGVTESTPLINLP